MNGQQGIGWRVAAGLLTVLTLIAPVPSTSAVLATMAVASNPAPASALAAGYIMGPPSTWGTSQTQAYQVTMTNVGTQTWNATGPSPVRLGIHYGGASDGWGTNWATDQRFFLPSDVPPGGSVTLQVSVTAPSTAGGYILRHRMVKEAVAWFDQIHKTSVSVNPTVPTSTPSGTLAVPSTATPTPRVLPAPAAAPLNDQFASATVISALPLTINQSTVGATSESGEPFASTGDFCSTFSTSWKTVWLRLSPNLSGDIVVQTAGSDFRTALSLYSTLVFDPTSVPGFSSLSRDQWCVVNPIGGDAALRFHAFAGRTYFIQVQGYPTLLDQKDEGNLVLRVARAATPTPTLVPTSPTPSPSPVCLPLPAGSVSLFQFRGDTRDTITGQLGTLSGPGARLGTSGPMGSGNLELDGTVWMQSENDGRYGFPAQYGFAINVWVRPLRREPRVEQVVMEAYIEATADGAIPRQGWTLTWLRGGEIAFAGAGDFIAGRLLTSAPVDLADGRPRMITVTRTDPSRVELYIDSVLTTVASGLPAVDLSAPTPLLVGRRRGEQQFMWSGGIGPILVMKGQALTGDAIKKLYISGLC